MVPEVSVVTGASSGIGEAVAAALASKGSAVVIAARRKERLDSLAAKIEVDGGRVLPVVCDVTDQNQVSSLFEKVRDAFGPADCLVNNAGVMPLSFMEKTRLDEWHRMVDVNVRGVLNCVGYALPDMIQREWGHIVNVASMAGHRVYPGGAVYCGTKFFVRALSEGLRMELADKNIRVTIISPGLVETELWDGVTDEDMHKGLDRLRGIEELKPGDIARAVLYALEQPAHVGVNEILIRPTAQKT